MSRRKKIVFALTAIVLALTGCLIVLLGADLYVHHRAERSAGLNRHGYRGPVIPRKQPGELRVVMLGGSTVFGYGVAWNESIPSYLERRLQERVNRPVRVVNLGFNNEGAHAFLPNLEDFAFLDYDVVVLYEGYNDLAGDAGPNRAVYRRNSAVYRTFGYYPILPLYLEEKARMLQFGNVNAGYEAIQKPQERVVFRPGLAQRSSAAALQAISSMTSALDGQLAHTIAAPAIKESESQLGCALPYVTYCESVAAAVRYGLARAVGVVVASQPAAIGGTAYEGHRRQRATLAAMVAREFGREPRVAWADNSTLLDLHNIDVTFDGMHLKPDANATVAAALVDPVVRVAEAAKQ